MALTLVALAYSAPAHAEKMITEAFDPTRVEMSDVVEVHLLNFGNKPVGVKLEIRDATTFFVLEDIAASGLVAPGSGTTLAIVIDTDNFPTNGTLFPVLQTQGAKEAAAIVVAAEIRDVGGHTRAFVGDSPLR